MITALIIYVIAVALFCVGGIAFVLVQPKPEPDAAHRSYFWTYALRKHGNFCLK
jgi:hypothetical protein